MRAPLDREALVVGMTLVPALLSRNRSFALFENQDVRRARVRAALLRGIVRQLAGTQGQVESFGVVPATGAASGGREVHYRLPGIRVERRSLLSDVEYACVAYLAGRAGVPGLCASDEDRLRIDGALRRLGAGLGE
jgi:D-aminopeptidase